MTGANCREDSSRVLSSQTLLYNCAGREINGHAQTRITDGALKYKLSKIRLGFDLVIKYST